MKAIRCLNQPSLPLESTMTDMLLKELRIELMASVDEKTLATGANFFKEEIHQYGVKVPVVNKIAASFYKKMENPDKTQVLEFCNELWQSGYIEESFIACHWAEKLGPQYVPEDFIVFEKWLSESVSNWASCDTLCNHTVGDFVMKYPEFVHKLIDFTGSDNRWMRRAAAVTLIIPARKGFFQPQIFEIAEHLLTDPDDLVQKGYGWMLKAASESDQKAVFDFVIKHKSVMPRTALRYAIEKMPDSMRKEAMSRN